MAGRSAAGMARGQGRTPEDEAAAGAIAGAGAVRDNGGSADEVVAGAIGGAAASVDDRPSGVIPGESEEELPADADLAGEGEAPAPADPNPDVNDDLDGGVDTSAMEAAADRAELIAGSLVGDMRDAMMEVFKHRPKPWSQMLAGEQKDVATAIEYAAKRVVQKAVLALAAEDRPSIRAIFKGYTDTGGTLEGKVKFFEVKDEDVLSLHRASGKEVLLVVADAQAFIGQRREPSVDKDDPELGFDAGTDDHPDAE